MDYDGPRVVIVGAGFGGLRVARSLRGTRLRVLLLDRHNYHLFQPLLYQVATAGLEPEQIAKSVRSVLGPSDNVQFRMAEVTAIDLSSRHVITAGGSIPYDYLVVAAGTEPDFFGMASVQSNGFALKDLADAAAIRNHVLTCFEEAAAESDESRRRALLTLVVVGGGPTGVEMVGAFSELVSVLLRKDYREIRADEVKVILLEARGQLLGDIPLSLSHAAEAILRRKGVCVRLGTMVRDYDGSCVTLANGETVPARTLIWAAGVRATGLTARLGKSTGPMGRAAVTSTLQLPGHPEVFVVGDAALLWEQGRPLPMMAPVAVQMADTAATNIRKLTQGSEPVPFRYEDPGSLATIGRNAAVANVGGLRFRGFLAWMVWLVVHLVNLIGFRNRILVLINWAWDYLFYDRGVRIITQEGRTSPVPNEPASAWESPPGSGSHIPKCGRRS